MAKKLNIPKAAQIRGIRKALANLKTPKQFRAGLKKRLAKLLTCILFALASSSARAQAPVSLVPTQQTLAAAGTACAGTTQTFPVNNRNQTQHTATLVLSGTASASTSLQIQGIDSAGNSFIISPTAQPGALFGGISAIVSASGYYPTVNVLVTCPVAVTMTLTYVGSQGSSVILSGQQFISLIDQQIFSAQSGNFNSTVFPTPFGNSSGLIQFRYITTAGAGGSIEVLCLTAGSGAGNGLQFIFPLANATTTQLFKVPPSTCPQAQVLYVAGGSSGNANEEYVFDAPGTAVNSTLGSYSHITGTTATAVKATEGTLVSVTLNTPAAGTVSVFDLASASCTGTPSTSTVAVITAASATDAHETFSYNATLLNGICLKASAAMDITVSYQ